MRYNLSINIRILEASQHCLRTLSLVLCAFLALGSLKPAFADTYVGGSIHGKTVWTVNESPYYVGQSIWVNVGATLTIEPGVKVLFSTSQGVLVEGTLIAKATSEAPIIFSSAAASPAAGDWDGIIFAPNSIDAVIDGNGSYLGGSVISDAEISFGGSIQAESSSPLLTDNHIHNMSGIPLRDWPRGSIWACNSHMIIRQNFIDGNDQSGIVLLGSRALVEGNIISQNKGGDGWGGGVMLGNSSCALEHEPSNSSVIRGNFIGYNQATAMGGGVAIYAGNHTIENNCIVNNFTPKELQEDSGGAAIGLLSGASIIQGNELVGNVGAEGIFLGAPTHQSGQLSFNNISNPDALSELVVGTSASPTVASQLRVDARSNFWGSLDAQTLSSRIADNQDEIWRPFVVTEPLLTSRVETAACALNPFSAFPPLPPEVLTPKGPGITNGSGTRLLIESIGVSSRTIRSEDLIALNMKVSVKENVSGWVVLTSSEQGKDRITYGLRCAEGRCIGMLKGNSITSRFYKSRKKQILRSKKQAGIKLSKYLKVSATVYASAGGITAGRRVGSLRLVMK